MYSPTTFGRISSLTRRSSYDNCVLYAPQSAFICFYLKLLQQVNVSLSIWTHTVEQFSNVERKTLIIIA